MQMIKDVSLTEDEVIIKNIFDGNDVTKENITVVDSIMGSGKTSWAIEKMKQDGQYMYITQFVDEIERVQKELNGVKRLYAPTNKNEYGTKKYDFHRFIKSGVDISATHALFRGCDKEILEHIKLHNYILILDEVMEVVKIETLSMKDYEMLVATKMISIGEKGKVEWLDDSYNGKFDWVKKCALAGQLYKHSSQDSEKMTFFVWQFPVEIFKYFKEVFILTYLFDGQIQKYYFDLHGLKYNYKQVELIKGKYELIDYDEANEYKRLADFKNLINIYKGNLNDIGNGRYTFSVSFFRNLRNKEIVEQLKKNTENYMQHIVKGKSHFNMWTTFGENESKLKGRGYARGFIAVNARSTNQYAHKKNLAYLANRFLPPYEYSYFKDLGIEIDQELWALSELVQWIWRSAIRNNESINIYIPSSRMRDLLINWLSCEVKEIVEVAS